MNILLLSGSPRKNGNTNALLEELTAGILEAGKHSVKTVDVTRMKIAPCLGWLQTGGKDLCPEGRFPAPDE